MGELGEVLGGGRKVGLAGVEFDVRPLDFNDLVKIEERFGGIERLDFSSISSQLFIVTLILRKSDPALDEEKVGAMMTLNKIPQVASFITEALAISGLVSDEAEGPEKNEGAATVG